MLEAGSPGGVGVALVAVAVFGVLYHVHAAFATAAAAGVSLRSLAVLCLVGVGVVWLLGVETSTAERL